jgi:arylsulfatase
MLIFRGAVIAAAATPPNIILILTDDQGYGDLSCHGNPILKTPSLDRLHRESMRFTDFHVSPTCAPTRCALMTGRHEFKSGVTHTINERERMSLKTYTLPQAMKSAGYSTGIFGKWHLGDEADRRPDKRGFDETFIHGGGGIGQSYPGSCGDAPGNHYFDPVILHNGKFVRTQGYCTDVFFAQATRWIEGQHSRKTPFFAYVTPNAPHAPLDVPAEYARPYLGKVSTNVAKFYGMIANIDQNVGRLLDRLAVLNLATNTLVIFMNDNGTATGEGVWNAGMRGKKCTPWIGGTRAASFWRWPGTLEPGDIPVMAAHIDVFPTLAEIAQVKLPTVALSQIEGRSLLPLLRNPAAQWEDRTMVTHVGRWDKGQAGASKYLHCSIRNSRYQMVSDAKNGGKDWQLFDLKSDPGQQTDVASAHPEVMAQLEVAYDRWWDSSLPCLENENLNGPVENPFKTLYREQFR